MMSDPDKLFRTVTDFTIFDNNLIGHAREVFDDYIEKGIILSYDFDHHKWETTNEYANLMSPFYSTSIPFNTNGSINLS